MIRQAITCDICASEKRQTNHWFVAYEQGGELRVSGWNSRHRLRPGSKHLCGQTCLHKLVDDFMARSISVRMEQHTDGEESEELSSSLPVEASHSAALADMTPTDTSLTAVPTDDMEFESSARLIPTPETAISKPLLRPQSGIVTMPQRPLPEEFASLVEDKPRYASRNWRTEAWERERAREKRADLPARRRSRA